MTFRTLTDNLTKTTIRNFLAGEIDASELPEPNWGPIGKEVYERTYSRETRTSRKDGTEEVTKETWAETVRRVVLGNLGYAPEHINEEDEAVRLFELFYTFKATPAGRHLWVTGTDSPYTRNCWCSGWDEQTSFHFHFLASRLFEGGGVGANYSADLLAATKPIRGELIVSIVCDENHDDIKAIRAASRSLWTDYYAGYEDTAGTHKGLTSLSALRVDDSREGWANAWAALIDKATEPGVHRVLIDLSDVRPHGAVLRTFGGRASGPAPLADAIVKITEILNQAGSDNDGDGRRLTGLDAMEIDHAIASAVVAGGSRRSARMSLMHWADPQIFDFIELKADPSRHWTTNVSVEIDDDFHAALAAGSTHAEQVLHAVAEGMARNGEPGLFDASAHSVGEPEPIRACNPCGEVSLQPSESCNLGSVNLAAFGTDTEAALEAFRLVARFLYRATLKPYPDPRAAAVEARNRRIGVGLMGLQGWVAAHGARLGDLWAHDELRERLNEFRATCRSAANAIADDLGTPHPVKVTSIAPTGTIAQLSGTTPGIHPVIARYFLRRVRYADTDPGLIELAERGYHIEDAIAEDNTVVVSFPVRDGILERYDEELIEDSSDFGVGDFIRLIATVQETFCAGEDGNAISATAQIPQSMDPEKIVASIRPWLGSVKGVTAFPNVSRPQSPYEPLTKQAYIEALDAVASNVETLVGDSNDGSCSTGACPVR